MDSGSGVIVGRERRQGLRASWNTESRFVRRSMSEFDCSRGSRNFESSSQPLALNEMASSSIRDRIAGTRRGNCDSTASLSDG